MVSFGEDVAACHRSGRPRALLRELCRDWKQIRTPYSVTHAVSNAAEDDLGQDLHATLVDEDFRVLRQQLSGLDGLREDIHTGLEFFAGRQPDLLKYLQVMFLEPAADQEFLTAHQQHCRGFADFLQLDLLPHERRQLGLHQVLQRFFPEQPKPHWQAVTSEQPVIHLVGYDLGRWRCSCGALTGLTARYSFNCPCGTVRGTGRLAPDTAACTGCGDAPAYVTCPACGTRVTLENLWELQEGNAHPSIYQIPLILELLITHPGRAAESTRVPLMLLPIPLGIWEREGTIVFGLPDILWLGELSGSHGPGPYTSTNFVSFNDVLRYDRQTDLRRIFESMFRRTLLKAANNSYRKFRSYIADRLRDDRISAPDNSYTRTFQERIRERLTDPSGRDVDMLRFIDLSAGCTVATSSGLRGNAALVSRRFAISPLLSVPYLLNVRAVLDDTASFTPQPPYRSAHEVALLDSSGLAPPGQTAEPGQVLAGIARRVTASEELSAEERLLQAIYRADHTVRDESLRMPGGRLGRVLAQYITVSESSADLIPPMPGRFIQRGGPTSITVTLAVDRRLGTGDTLLSGSEADTGAGPTDPTAVVCGIRSGAELSWIAGTGSEPDLVVAPDHPWAPASVGQTSRIRIRLSKDDPASHDMTYRGLGGYSLIDQPPGELEPGDTAALLTPQEFRWLIREQARHLALELYGPRSDCRPWRREFHESLIGSSPAITAPTGTPLAEWDSPSDSPSTAMIRWERLLRGARISSRISRNRIMVNLMTDAEVLELSHGEITQLEDLASQGLAPGGLFSERIFGPVRGWKCGCGKNSGRDLAGTVCQDCGVEVAGRDARWRRMGHIELPAPVVHSWFLRGAPQKQLADLLGMSPEELTQIADCDRYVVADPGGTGLRRGEVLQRREARGIEMARLAVGGEAVEILLRQISRSREPVLTPDRIIIRRIPVLPPNLRPDIRTNTYHLVSDLNNRYSDLLRWIIEDRARLISDGVFTTKSIYRLWHVGLQRRIDALFGRPGLPAGNQTAGARRSIADDLISRPGSETLRDNFLTRYTDFSASANLATSDTGDIGTALLPLKLAWTLLQPTITRFLVTTGIAENAQTAWTLAGEHARQAEMALDTACARSLVLLSFPTGPWRLTAMHIRPVDDHAVHVHPDLLDHAGWGNLGQRIKIFSVLTGRAVQEAERLLTPARLLDKTTHEMPDQPSGNSIFDLTRENVIGCLSQAAWEERSFTLVSEDSLLLCAADWTRD